MQNNNFYLDYLKCSLGWKGLQLLFLPMLFVLLALHKHTFCWKPCSLTSTLWEKRIDCSRSSEMTKQDPPPAQ